MNALIIGGSGGLSSVVARLAMKEYRVWTLTRGNREVPDGVLSVIADRNDPEIVGQALAAQHIGARHHGALIAVLVAAAGACIGIFFYKKKK